MKRRIFIPTSRNELLESGATCIGEVSSYEGFGKTVWTELSVWWNDDTQERPFIAVVEGRTSAAHLQDRFRASRHGTLDRALNWFDASDLREQLIQGLPTDLGIYPDANALRAAKAKGRGFRGAPGDFLGLLQWLYDDEPDLVPEELAARASGDFGMPILPLLDMIKGQASTPWARAWLASMRHFNRTGWRREKEA